MREAGRNAVFGLAFWFAVWAITDSASRRLGCIEIAAYTRGHAHGASTIYACTEVQPDLRRINIATFPDGTRRHLHPDPR